MKFNEPKSKAAKVINYEGAEAYKTDAKTELVSRVLCSLVGEKKFYVSGEESNKELISLLREVANKDPEFCLRLAAYARREMYLRSIPQLILVEMANHPQVKGTSLIQQLGPHIIQRADEITECLSYQLEKFGKPLPNSLKKVFAEALNRFNRYSLSKYNRKAKVELRDAMFLSHPKPKDEEHIDIFKKLANQTLESPETWEVVISTKGSTKENWQSIMPKMPIFATLRNLRNFLEKDTDLIPAIKKLTNSEIIKNSKLLPFRFLSAYREIEQVASSKTQSVLEAVSHAMELSLDNIPQLNGYTCIAVDNSGSMDNLLSERSVVKYCDIASTMGAVLNKVSNSLLIVFSENAHFLTLNKNNDILSNVEKILGTCVMSSTNTYRVPELLIQKQIKIDRLILLSDMQCWDSEGGWGGYKNFAPIFKEYKTQINPECYLYSVDLAGYGKGIQVPQHEKNTVLLAGWSDKIFDFIAKWEGNRVAQIKKIENYLT